MLAYIPQDAKSRSSNRGAAYGNCLVKDSDVAVSPSVVVHQGCRCPHPVGDDAAEDFEFLIAWSVGIGVAVDRDGDNPVAGAQEAAFHCTRDCGFQALEHFHDSFADAVEVVSFCFSSVGVDGTYSNDWNSVNRSPLTDARIRAVSNDSASAR